MVRKGGGVADPDCPTSAEDMAYWVVTSRQRMEVEPLERVAEVNVAVDAQDLIGALTPAHDRIDALTGLPLNTDQGPASSDLLKFVKESAGQTQVQGRFFFAFTALYTFFAYVFFWHSWLGIHGLAFTFFFAFMAWHFFVCAGVIIFLRQVLLPKQRRRKLAKEKQKPSPKLLLQQLWP